jgi:hypothetical protein
VPVTSPTMSRTPHSLPQGSDIEPTETKPSLHETTTAK